MLFAAIAIEKAAYGFDRPFTYQIPSVLEGSVRPGMRVMVPFGTGNQSRVGIVLSLLKEAEGKTKEILSVLDDEPVLADEMLRLIPVMKNRYYCTLFEAAKTMLPAGLGFQIRNSYILDEGFKDFDEKAYTDVQWQVIMLLHGSVKAVPAKKITDTLGIDEKASGFLELLNRGIIHKVNTATTKIGDAVSKMVRPLSDFSGKLTPKQKTVYDTLCDVGPASLKELSYFTGASSAVVKTMAQKGAVEVFEYEVYRRPKVMKTSEQNRETILSLEQQAVYIQLQKEYAARKGGTALLYGVTGSGKTSVFLKLIEHVVGQGQAVILMVPEISLTAQTISLFTECFGENIAVFHSALSLGERLDEWKRVKRSEAKIVIGTRSAVFAPVENLGLIVIDEEQEHTYKSESSPRYDAREIARYRCKSNRGLCLLSSATPSVESFYMAEKGVFTLHKLQERFGSANIPEVLLADMNEESYPGSGEVIGETLAEALRENYDSKKQSIILLNRRGYHAFASCKDCKEVISCPHCSISLTYHQANNRLMCHYCCYSVKYEPKCPACGSERIAFRGMGTQRAEEELKEILPDANILRIDTDSVAQRFSLEKKLAAFANGEYDIMVGTQMVAKGLDFENVTLVGVLSADQALFSDDFRCYERTFDLLTQVVGRAGRGKFPGKAIIQTYVPENPYLALAAAQDYEGFFKREILFRRALLYPPFADLLVVGFVGPRESAVKKSADYYLARVGELAGQEYPELPLRILRASPAAIVKVSNKFRYKIIMKCKNTEKLREMTARLLKEFLNHKEFKDITAYADNNPYSIL